MHRNFGLPRQLNICLFPVLTAGVLHCRVLDLRHAALPYSFDGTLSQLMALGALRLIMLSSRRGRSIASGWQLMLASNSHGRYEADKSKFWKSGAPYGLSIFQNDAISGTVYCRSARQVH